MKEVTDTTITILAKANMPSSATTYSPTAEDKVVESGESAKTYKAFATDESFLKAMKAEIDGELVTVKDSKATFAFSDATPNVAADTSGKPQFALQAGVAGDKKVGLFIKDGGTSNYASKTAIATIKFKVTPADGKTLKITIPTAANFRAFVGSDIATSSWWTREFNVIDGKLVYRTGDELASVPVLKGQVVTIDFNALTGTITGDGEEEEQEPYSLIGWHAADSWSTNVPLVDVEGQPDWRVAQNIGANSGNIDFKFRRGEKWVPQIGAEDKNPKKVNVKFKVSEKTEDSQADPANIHLDGNGLYDVYLNEKDLICFILDAGTAFAVPTEWESGETPELDWYIIGDAVGGWSNENDVPFESFDDSWYAAKNVSILGEKNFKFRANHAWTYQLTCPGMRTIGIIFSLEDGNGSDNDMQVPSDGVYDVYLSKELTSAVILTAGSAFGGGGEEPKGITIDGDFSDWDGISGVSDGNYEMFKVASDADNIYFFSWRNTGGRYSEIWNGEGYVYFGFDLDNNSETGVTLWGNGPLEFVGVIWPYGDHAIIEAPESAYGPDGKTIPGVVCKGVVDDSGVKIEFSVPRSSLPEIPTTSVLAWSRGNKDLNTVTYNVTL